MRNDAANDARQFRYHVDLKVCALGSYPKRRKLTKKRAVKRQRQRSKALCKF